MLHPTRELVSQLSQRARKDPHSLIRPETIHPSTATDLLEQILARDGTARSATTLQRDQHHPAARLADAAGRYVDALHVAAEDLAGREVVAALDVAAEQMVPGLIDEPAWPILRAHLLLLAAHGTDPVAQLATVAASRELSSADDRAAVLDWRLDDTGHRNAAPGTLPWLPGIPTQLGDHPMWRNYLAARSDLVRTLANQTIFGAREDISTRPAGTTDAMLSGPAVRNWVEPDLAVAALVRDVAGPRSRPTPTSHACSPERPPGRNVRSAATGSSKSTKWP